MINREFYAFEDLEPCEAIEMLINNYGEEK